LKDLAGRSAADALSALAAKIEAATTNLVMEISLEKNSSQNYQQGLGYAVTRSQQRRYVLQHKVAADPFTLRLFRLLFKRCGRKSAAARAIIGSCRHESGGASREHPMTLIRVPAFTMIAMVWLGVQAEAQTPCAELLRLRNAATEAWKDAMRVSPSERCAALYHASSAAETTLKFANDNRNSCDVSVRMLNQVEGYHREAVQARDNACAGRPLRPYPADIIQR
jgi:hypothetical protein